MHLPVEEHHRVAAFHGETDPPEERVGGSNRQVDLLVVLEAFERAHAREALLDGVVAGALGAPDEVQRAAEGLVPQRLARVDDVLTVAAHHDELPVAVVLERLQGHVKKGTGGRGVHDGGEVKEGTIK